MNKNELTELDKEKIYLISKYHPFSAKQVKKIYLLVNKSYDDTVFCLRKSKNLSETPEDLALKLRD